jgi:uncharacterized protein YjbI with pentapeptide repeats
LVGAQAHTEARVDQLVVGMDRVEGRIGNLEGSELATRYRRNLGSFLRRVLVRPRTVIADDLDALMEARNSARVGDEELQRIDDLDFLVIGRSRDDGEDLVLACEVSYTLNADDVTRAETAAETLRRAGYRAKGFVGATGSGNRRTTSPSSLASRLTSAGHPPRKRGRADDATPSAEMQASCPRQGRSRHSYADFRGCDFTGANLRDGGLLGAWFDGSSLIKGDLRGAALARASFVDADLTDADLTGALLAGVNFRGSNLTRARLLPGFLGSALLANTTGPDGTRSDPTTATAKSATPTCCHSDEPGSG